MTERQQQLVQNVEKHRQMILDAERWLASLGDQA